MNNPLAHILNAARYQQFLRGLLVAFIITVNLLRFFMLDKSPQGFHVDEMSAAVTTQCMATEGTDTHGKPFPLLFSNVNYGSPHPPTALYFGVLWGKLFGFSQAACRASSAFLALLSVLGLFLIGTLLHGKSYGLVVCALGSISPWLWPVSRIYMTGIWAVFFLIWGLFFLLKSTNRFMAGLSGLCFALGMYSYPSLRLQAGLLFPLLLFFAWKNQRIKASGLVISITVFAAALVPMAVEIMQGQLMERFQIISIMSGEFWEIQNKPRTIPNLLLAALYHFALHFSPAFLFLKSSKHGIYSSNFCGVLGWGEWLALAVGLFALVIRPKTTQGSGQPKIIHWKKILLAGIILGILPSALTWHDIPHPFRSIGALPFAVLLLGEFLQAGLQRHQKTILTLFCVTMIAFAFFYLRHYYWVYGPKTYWMFNQFTKEKAAAASSEKDWLEFLMVYRDRDYHACYYLMNEHGDACSLAREKWTFFHKKFPAQK